MDVINPYAPPGSVVDDLRTATSQVQPIRLFSPSGRIGRLRYLAYVMAAGLAEVVVNSAASVVALPMHTPYLAMIVYGLVFLASIWVGSVWAIQRAHDMDWSGWSCLLMLIPFVMFFWLLKSGSPGVNRFGAPPPPNTTGVKLVACLLPFVAIFVVGLLAAIAIPAYQVYQQRAHAVQAGRV